ncbi:MAG TPA: alpha/beta hydrolase [Vicinamibacterales bacterium]|nr:alpha/beta hydrolase [Vicinamibacterales bacterium]
MRHIEINGVDLHYDIVGDGEPVLWVHGFFGAGSDWRYVFPEPPANLRLIAPDLRGHGASTNPSDEFSFRQAAADLESLLDHLGIASVKAIGVSGGGIVLLHMATARPARLESMVIVSAPPYFPLQARAVQRQVSESTFGEAELGMMRMRHGEERWQQLLRHCRGLADSYDDVSFTPPSLSRVSARTLIVFGDDDPLYPVALALELRAAIPASHLWILPGAGHAPIFGPHAPAFVATALPFLQGAWPEAARAMP